jgi:hypothetical protein
VARAVACAAGLWRCGGVAVWQGCGRLQLKTSAKLCCSSTPLITDNAPLQNLRMRIIDHSRSHEIHFHAFYRTLKLAGDVPSCPRSIVLRRGTIFQGDTIIRISINAPRSQCTSTGREPQTTAAATAETGKYTALEMCLWNL